MALEFPLWLRLAHVFNLLFTTLLIRSGLGIVGAHPRFYWNDDAIPGTEWLRAGDETRSTDVDLERIDADDTEERAGRDEGVVADAEASGKGVTDGGLGTESATPAGATGNSAAGAETSVSAETSTGTVTESEADTGDLWTAEDEAEPYSPWIALPGRDSLGLARHWHFWGAAGWLLTGLIYVVLLFGTGQWDRLVPTSWGIFPQAWDAFVTYLTLDIPGAAGYNALQKLSYFAMVFVLSPLMIVTGVLQAPAVRAHFPERFGHLRQRVRSVHFLGTIVFVAFILVHVGLVVAHGFAEEMAKVLLGSPEASEALALWLTAAWIGGVIPIHAVGNWASLNRPRVTKRILEVGVDPLLKALFHHHNESVETVDAESDGAEPSAFARVNGKPPRNEEYREHAAENFANWTLAVDGLVENELELSIEELQELPRRSQTTRHDCIQGWTYFAQWGGVPIAEIVDRCEPAADVEWVVFHTLDEKWEYSEEGPQEPVENGYYYEAIAMDKATEPGTIIADEMNGEELPIAFGAPLRLRIRSQLGYKMAKWVTRIEFVEDVEHVGQGQGGWRDDVLDYFPSSADI